MRMLLFGDSIGIPQLLRHIPATYLCGLVVAANRPQYHEHVRAIAKAMGLPFFVQPLPSNAGYVTFKSDVEALAPELIWIYSYSMIVRDDVLSIPRLGGINIHGALLPEYRGCNPTEWAIINGETTTGVTLHEISSGIDEGRIIDRGVTPILFEDTWREATDRVIAETDRLIAKNLESIIFGNWRSTDQDESKAHYCRRRFFDDGRFQWGQPILEIYNIVRALVWPHPGASYFQCDGSLVVISEHKTLAELTLLKYRHGDSGFLRGPELDLIPIPRSERVIDAKSHVEVTEHDELGPSALVVEEGDSYSERHGSVSFLVAKTTANDIVGWCQILNILWDRRVAEVLIRVADGAAVSGAVEMEVVDLITGYAVKELKLNGIARVAARP